jgi:hypothetical protein
MNVVRGTKVIYSKAVGSPQTPRSLVTRCPAARYFSVNSLTGAIVLVRSSGLTGVADTQAAEKRQIKLNAVPGSSYAQQTTASNAKAPCRHLLSS